MKINTNKWNKVRYTVHSLYYDAMMIFFRNQRRIAMDVLSPQEGESVLIVAAGTGLDLPYLSKAQHITATDITPAMLKKLEKKAKQLSLKVNSQVMDGQRLLFADNSFDCVVLNLILAVIPDPIRCIKEAERVLKPDGRILVFDKFLGENQTANIFRKGVNVISNIFFSEINRKFSSIIASTNLMIEVQKPSLFKGLFMIYRLRKN